MPAMISKAGINTMNANSKGLLELEVDVVEVAPVAVVALAINEGVSRA